jgi:hypothetical protein
MLHHIEPKYYLNCCTYLIWFEFESWFEFKLKTLEKINRKNNRNSRKKEKANSAQTSPLSPAPARAPVAARPRCLTGGPHMSAPTSARSLPLPALWGRAVGAVLFPCTLSLCTTVPTCQSSQTSHPRSPRRGHAHDRTFSGHVLASVPLLSPAPCSPTSPRSYAPLPNPLALSLALPTQAESSATARRRLLPVLRSPSRLRPHPVSR